MVEETILNFSRLITPSSVGAGFGSVPERHSYDGYDQAVVQADLNLVITGLVEAKGCYQLCS